jgi:hypothetical protein
MRNKCPICGAGGLGNLEYTATNTDVARFTTYKCKVCNCKWHIAIYPGDSMEHIDSIIRSYLTEMPMKKIMAIKAFRSVTGYGLKESKEYVDRIESGMYASGQLTPNANQKRIMKMRGY